ncbi:MAG: TIGR03960 family B12-binding radical SAM protein [Nitrospinae bacterium]|nr:TIGR03960 family B12-binding radical SAM protein [Nitrospinota bacterium]
MTTEYLEIINRVHNPSRYIGIEVNSVHKEIQPDNVHLCLAFPDKYDIGSSHHGLKILYHLVNNQDGFHAERLYAPEDDFAEALQEKELAIPSLESKTPLHNFDLVGFSLQYELSYTNLLYLLDLGKIPLFSAERLEAHPIIIAGGPSAFNPEPLAEFVDIFFIGDGEAQLLTFLKLFRELKLLKLSRREKLNTLYALAYNKEAFLQSKTEKNAYQELRNKYDTVMLTGLYFPHYTKLNELGVPLHIDGEELTVKKAEIADLNSVTPESAVFVPFGDSVHNRVSIEVDRGCTQGCRYCQAGYIYRPVRERTPEVIESVVRETIPKTGYGEISYLSLSLGDFKGLASTHNLLSEFVQENNIKVSYPSLRTGSFKGLISDDSHMKSSSYTITIEAGSERLRRVINKKISREELFETVKEIVEAGYTKLKIYTMIGLPTETTEDVEEIGKLAVDLLKFSRSLNKKGLLQLNLAVSPFVPKSQTPFQWSRQNSPEEIYKKIDAIREIIRPHKTITLKWHNPYTSFLEGIFARGGRKAGEILLKSYKYGAKFDAWTESFNRQAWEQALIGEETYLEELLWKDKSEETPFPFDFIDCGVSKEFLYREYENGLKEKVVPDCREENLCIKCGIDPCFKNIYIKNDSTELKEEKKPEKNIEGEEFYFVFSFSKTGWAKYLSHHELMDIVLRLFRRLRLKLFYSGGYHPRPKLTFSTAALPVGLETESEEFLIVFKEKPAYSNEELVHALNSSSVKGISFNSVHEIKKEDRKRAFRESKLAVFHIQPLFKERIPSEVLEKALDELKNKSDIILKRQGKKEKVVNVKESSVFKLSLVEADHPLIYLEIDANFGYYWIALGVGEELMKAIHQEYLCINIKKL